MSLADLWTISRAKQVERLSVRVAGQSHDEIADQIAGEAHGMGLAELRGYVRAQAGAIIRRMVDSALAEHQNLPLATRAQIISRATDLAVYAVAQQVYNTPRLQTAFRKAS